MKILIVANSSGLNQYVPILASSLGAVNGIHVDVSEQIFLTGVSSYDIIHFHWPEHLIGLNEGSDISRVLKRIDHFRAKGTKLVITRHNDIPHNSSLALKQFYEDLYKRVDGVIHLGSASFLHATSLFKQVVIEHFIYPLRKRLQQRQAREFFGLSSEDFVVVAFGSLRNSREESLVTEAFVNVGLEQKRLLISNGCFPARPSLKLSPFSWVGWHVMLLQKRFLLKRKGIIYNVGYVDENMMSLFLEASDVVFVSRSNTLNSGNVYLALSYGKAIVGPDYGNIGQILRKTGNSVFEPGNVQSASDAIGQAYVDHKTLGERNSQYASKIDNLELAKNHLDFYRTLIREK